ncbi:hypothetical protein Glove_213g220 [Diversispora epigaea]|uniref:Protein kinase domain-containing protein n=1 Tax=Diversispora epigaea TaxID=1348612 RepID=A0A397IKE2_9GLOM|nr:hypothetical protein Glove_213g220 [Diversispora epigaea]
MSIHLKTWTRDASIRLSLNLKNIHELDIVHQDFHPGNILLNNFKNYSIRISDFGSNKLIGENPNNPEKKNIFGVLPRDNMCGCIFIWNYCLRKVIMKCWDARVTHRATFEELSEEFSENEKSINTTTIHICRLNFSKLPKPRTKKISKENLKNLLNLWLIYVLSDPKKLFAALQETIINRENNLKIRIIVNGNDASKGDDDDNESDYLVDPN